MVSPSGRRARGDQARAMAGTVVKNLQRITETYAASGLRTALQSRKRSAGWPGLASSWKKRVDWCIGMPSSEPRMRVWRNPLTLLGVACVLVACKSHADSRGAPGVALAMALAMASGTASGAASSSTSATTSAMAAGTSVVSGPLHCGAHGGALPAPRTAELAALRAAVEQGPLFAAVAAGRVPTCSASNDGSQWQLDYRFADDATLRVTRDTAIDYTDVTARMRLPLASDPRAVLQRAERASFAPDGCGIDWKTPAESSATTQVWRGDVCHCQARVQRDPAGGVIGLVLRSAC